MSTTPIHETAEQLADLFVAKNAAYGNSIGKSVEMLKLIFPNGISPDYYLDAILYARRFDKWSRLAQGADLHGEDPRLDDAGYSLYALHQAKEAKAWPDSASDVASTPSKAPHDSAAQSTRPKTTATAAGSSETPNFPSSESSRANTSASASTSSPASAPAPTATANASASVADLERALATFREFEWLWRRIYDKPTA